MMAGRRTKPTDAKRTASSARDAATPTWWKTDPWRTVLLAIVLIAITANAYSPIFGMGYIWDDDSYVTRNPTLETTEGLRRIWFELGATPQYYPLVFTTFWLEYQWFGLNPAVSHAVNLALHCAGALLLWRVLVDLGVANGIAWTAALVFAVHPVHVESVAWITERKNVLSGCFFLGALASFLEFDRRRLSTNDVGRSRRGWWYALALVLLLAALLSKTVTATLPIVILIVLWYRRGRVTAGDILRIMPFLALGVATASVTVWVERHQVGAMGDEFDLSLVERVLLAGRAAWFYAGKLVWPQPLVFIYPRWQIDSSVPWQYLYPAAAFGLVAVCWRWRGKLGPGPLVAVLCFAVMLGPALGFVSVFPMRYSYVADHFQYLASTAIIALLAGWGWNICARSPAEIRALVFGGCVAWIATLAVLTWQQTHDYVDLETLWTQTLAKNPQAWIAAHNLGVMHLERGEMPLAERYFQQVVEVRPEDGRALNNLGLLALRQRDVDRAVQLFERAAHSDAAFIGAWYNLARIRLAQGKTPSAIDLYLSAVRIAPMSADDQEVLAVSLLRAADPADRDRFFQELTSARPHWPRLVGELAWILATSASEIRREPGRALALAQQAIEMRPAPDARMLDVLAAAQAATGQFQQAVETAARAAEQARRTGDVNAAAAIEARKQRYENHQPYLSPPDPAP